MTRNPDAQAGIDQADMLSIPFGGKGSEGDRSECACLHATTTHVCGAAVCPRSKLLAEQRAYEIAQAQRRWTLVTILPPIVQGPPPGGLLT